MAVGDIIVCMDLGSSKVSIVAGQVNKFNEIEVIGYGLHQCTAMKKGRLIDTNLLEKALRKIITDCEDTAGVIIKSAYINVKGMHAKREKRTVTVEVKDYDAGITRTDILESYKILRDSPIGDKEEIIDIVPIKYFVDEKETDEEPIGAMCKELRIETELIISKDNYIENIIKAFKHLDIKLDGVVLESLAVGNIVLMPEEKKMGVALVDIGATTTEISVYKNNKLLFNETLPLGGDNITYDISLTLGVSFDEAEKLKRQYNLGMAAMITNNHEVRIQKDDGTHEEVRCSDIVEIIEARIKEIYELVKNILANGKVNDIIECVVITGQGMSNIVGAEEQAILGLKISQVRICNPRLINVIKPEQILAYGMVKHIATSGTSRKVSSDVEILIEPTIKDKLVSGLSKAKELLKRIKNRNEEDEDDIDEGGF